MVYDKKYYDFLKVILYLEFLVSFAPCTMFYFNQYGKLNFSRPFYRKISQKIMRDFYFGIHLLLSKKAQEFGQKGVRNPKNLST